MKLEVGMYVRTKNGLIAKYIGYEKSEDDIEFSKYNFDGKIYWYYEYYNDYVYEEDFEEWFKEEVIKTSHNIIDLIEEDDLIKCQFGEQTLILQVGARYKENSWIKGVFTPDNEFWALEALIQEDILHSIVTKEAFQSTEYKVGDNK